MAGKAVLAAMVRCLVMGLALGSGYLDLGILTNGILDLPFGFKILANTPHIALGGFALIAGTKL